MTQDQQPKSGEMDFHVPRRKHLEPGEVIKGTIVMIGESHVFLDVGTKSEAIMDIKEFSDDKGKVTVEVGQEVEAFVVTVEPELVLSQALARSHLNIRALEDAQEMGIPVEGRVTGQNKGGFEIDLNGVRAFCPISQIQASYCEDPSVHLQQKYQFKIMEFSEGGKNIVVSRRVLQEQQQQEEAEATQAQLFEGAEFEGEVMTLQPYGAFVDIGGIQGMVHISEIGHQRIEHPSEVLREGQKVRVRVIRVEVDPKHPDRMRVGLSIKALLGDPWDEATASLSEGSTVEGKVVRLQPFGAFVEIAPGVDGLVHISEMAERRIKHPEDVVSVGQEVMATVLKVDRSARRISLSLRDDSHSGSQLAVGEVVDVVVNRVKQFGLLVSIKGHGREARGMIPAEETGASRDANLRRIFPEGSELRAMVSSIDPKANRIRLSITGVEEQAEQQEYKKFVNTGTSQSEKQEGMGTLGEALMKALKKEKE